MRKTMLDSKGRMFFVGQIVSAHTQGHSVKVVIKKFRVKVKEVEVQIVGKKYNFFYPIDGLWLLRGNE